MEKIKRRYNVEFRKAMQQFARASVWLNDMCRNDWKMIDPNLTSREQEEKIEQYLTLIQGFFDGSINHLLRHVHAKERIEIDFTYYRIELLKRYDMLKGIQKKSNTLTQEENEH
jgi:hypothetical protein